MSYCAKFREVCNFLCETTSKAMKIGAIDVVVKDVKQLFVEQFIWPAIAMGLIYEKRYLLGTSLARPAISSKQQLFKIFKPFLTILHLFSGFNR